MVVEAYYLNNPVLWWTTSLPPEHAINWGSKVGHSQRVFSEAQLAWILMHFVVIQPPEGLVRWKDHFSTVILEIEAVSITNCLQQVAIYTTQ